MVDEKQWEEAWSKVDFSGGATTGEDELPQTEQESPVAPAPADVPALSATDEMLKEVLAQMKVLREDAQKREDQINVLKREVAASKTNPLEPNMGMENWIPVKDKLPAIEEKLDIMERKAVENGTIAKFDRDFERKWLMGEGEEREKFVFNGHEFDSQRDMDVYIAKIEEEKDKTLGKYPR